MTTNILRRRITYLLVFFIAALFVSGVTAIPLKWEVDRLRALIGNGTWMESVWPALAQWITLVHQGITAADAQYPFLLYGTDWLAFAHIVIAIAFWGPLRDPVKNVWVIEFGLIACVLIVPTALVFGAVRGIPLGWRLLDCSFGIGGFVPLWWARKYVLQLQTLKA
jgi:hypothetical protein